MKGKFEKKQLPKSAQDYIRQNYEHTSINDLAAELSITSYRVMDFMNEENLKRKEINANRKKVVNIEVNGFFNVNAYPEGWVA